MADGDYVVGVDVGTGSVRAALVSAQGLVVKTASHPIRTWMPQAGFYHQSSDDVWRSCCHVIKDVVGGVSPASVKGIGFDATCSLVVLDSDGRPVSISPDGEPEQNVILWMDHRAFDEAREVNDTGHAVLRYVGGKMSLEMQVPKLMWLKRHLPAAWGRAAAFYDLPDFLTWKATGADSRSLCSLVCKWSYEVAEDGVKGWNRDFFSKVGLLDLLENGCAKIGSVVLEPGAPCGNGLSADAARQLGLAAGTPVATSIIDAHAGGLGLIGCTVPGVPTADFRSRLALICGTSTCHMAVSDGAVSVAGAWGPYRSAMVPGMWLTEAGQSATGRLIDHTLDTHPATAALLIQHSLLSNGDVVRHLNALLERMAAARGLHCVDQLTADVHVWPDHHGNRSPLADPTLKGMVSGLTLAAGEEDLALLYLATVQALAYGTRHILERLEGAGLRRMDCLLLCGGLSRNPLFVCTQASAVGRPVAVPQRTEAVLGGAAVLGAVAGGLFGSVQEAVEAMSGPAQLVTPDHHATGYHDKKYKVFLRMVSDQLAYREIMES